MKAILDPHAQGAICAILRVGGTFDLAARYVGCSRKTIYNTADRDEKFYEQLKLAQSGNEIQLLNTIQEAGKDPKNWQAARWALTYMYPDRYQRRAGTMTLRDVQDLMSQLMRAVVSVVPDATLRENIRVQCRTVTRAAFRQAKEKPRGA